MPAWPATRRSSLPSPRHCSTREARSRGKVIVRRLADLRHVARDAQGFPLGREYRVFVYGDQVLTWGFYWDEFTGYLRADVNRSVRPSAQLAVEASRRLQVTFTAVDVAHLTSGEWIMHRSERCAICRPEPGPRPRALEQACRDSGETASCRMQVIRNARSAQSLRPEPGFRVVERFRGVSRLVNVKLR